jgi:hypothetical protein
MNSHFATAGNSRRFRALPTKRATGDAIRVRASAIEAQQ